MFNPVSDRFNITLLEEEMMNFWHTQRVYEKRSRSRQGEKAFILYILPPLTYARPGMQEAMAYIHQDLWSRYKSMRGYRVECLGGWNAHGLPLEIGAEQELDLTNKVQIEKFGIGHFNEHCHQLSLEAIRSRELLADRLASWIGLADLSSSFENARIENVWGMIKLGFENGLLVQDERVMPFCPRCGSVLSDDEAAMGSAQVDTLAVYVRMPLLDDPGTALLVWTDQPWSLPGNVAVAVNPDAEYTIVERHLPEGEMGKHHQPEKIILARALLDKVFGDEKVRVYETFRGSRLKGTRYLPLFQFIVPEKPAHRVILDDFNIYETGSGLVQLTPAFNAHDLQLTRQHDLPVLSLLNVDGTFVSELRLWRGMFFTDAEAYILQDLQERGLIYRTETRQQTASFCWGCGSPLLPVEQSNWFLRRQQSNLDWSIGRARFWGTPLPIWKCDRCANQLVVGSVADLSRVTGRDQVEGDLHRPAVDGVGFACPRCDGLMRRVPQILDAGWDAAALVLPQAGNQVEDTFPADLIYKLNGQSDHWLFALQAISHAFFDTPAYRNAINLPLMVEDRGDPNTPPQPSSQDPWDIVHDHGVDTMRWALISVSTSDQFLRISDDNLQAAGEDFLLPLWEAYAFLVNSAVRAGWTPDLAKDQAQVGTPVLHQWLASRLNLMVKEVTQALDNLDAGSAAKLVQAFVNDLAACYIPLCKRDFIRNPQAEARWACLSALYDAFVILSRILAPFTPFLAEELHQKLVRTQHRLGIASIHLVDWPTVDETLIVPELNHQMVRLQELAAQGKSQRQEAGVAEYQPLSEAVLTFGDDKEAQSMQLLDTLLKDSLRVREVRYAVDETSLAAEEMRIDLDTRLSSELVQEGLAEEFSRRILDFRQKAGLSSDISIRLFVTSTSRLAQAVRTWQTMIMEQTHCVELNLESQPSHKLSAVVAGGEQGRTRRLYTMLEFGGERVTFGIEKVADL